MALCGKNAGKNVMYIKKTYMDEFICFSFLSISSRYISIFCDFKKRTKSSLIF